MSLVVGVLGSSRWAFGSSVSRAKSQILVGFSIALSLSLLVYLKRRRELSTMPMHSLCILLDICMCKCYIFVDWFLNGWGQASDAYIIIEVFSENVSAVISQP